MLTGIALTVLVITGLLAGFFYICYHTFHGDLPGLFKGVILVLGIIGLIILIVSFL